VARVLVVDDEPIVRDALEQRLTREGFIVRAAAGLNQAFEALRTPAFDVVVLDIRMPDPSGLKRSGIDVLSFIRIHEHLKGLPVLVLTGGGLSDAEEEAIWGLQAYVLRKGEGWRMLLHYLKHLTSSQTPSP
jgi:CheY-like chemotaxis protein